DDLARVHREGDIVQDRDAAEPNAGAGDRQRDLTGGLRLGKTRAALQHSHAQSPCLLRMRRISHRKNGPPTMAVSMPSGRSAKGIAVRATRSASVSSSAPPRALAGSSS